MNNITKVWIYSERGHYDLMHPGDEAWQLKLCVWFDEGYTAICERFPAGEEEPDWYFPTDALDLIEERLESYWLSTKREMNRKKIAALRENLPQIEQVYARQKIAQLEKELVDWRDHLAMVGGSNE